MDIATTQAALELLGRRIKGQQGPQLTENCRPQNHNQALDIQDELAKQWCLQADDTVGAWKCLLPRPDKIVVAPIFTSTINTVSPVQIWPREQHARIEPELVFYFSKDLPARLEAYSESDIEAAVGRTHMALELIMSRYEDPTGSSHFDNLADCLMNQGVYVGPELDSQQSRHASTLDIKVSYDGQSQSFEGRHPDIKPRAALLWLVEYLRQRGIGIQAGQAVITGSYAGVIDVPLNTDVTIAYAGLGEFTVHFQGK